MYKWSSWWWTHGCSKHVEDAKNWIKSLILKVCICCFKLRTLYLSYTGQCHDASSRSYAVVDILNLVLLFSFSLYSILPHPISPRLTSLISSSIQLSPSISISLSFAPYSPLCFSFLFPLTLYTFISSPSLFSF